MDCDPIEQLRAICLALPEAVEKVFGGHDTPTFRVHDRIFAQYEERGGSPALWCKAPPGAQTVLVEADPGQFFVPPYVGHNGWIGMRLGLGTDWDEVTALVHDSYRMTAPKRLSKLLDDDSQEREHEGASR
jgi:hypothetical protein